MASQAATNFQKVPEGTPKSGLENHSNQGSVSYVSRLCNCEFGFDNDTLPSGKLTVCELERSTMLSMGQSTISMAIFNSKLLT